MEESFLVLCARDPGCNKELLFEKRSKNFHPLGVVATA
jgi:hypothetical protein